MTQNLLVTDCAFNAQGGQTAVQLYTFLYLYANFVIDRCQFISDGSAIAVNANNQTLVAHDFQCGVAITNSLFLCNNSAPIQFNATNRGSGGGLIVRNCTFLLTQGVSVGSNSSTVYPALVYNCFFYGGTALNASSLGMLIEDYNDLGSATRTNVTAGARRR